MLSCLLSSCGGEVSGGEQSVTDSVVPIIGVTRLVNNISGFTGSDVDGVGQPFLSLQDALDRLRPGDVLRIEDSGVPYTSTNTVIGQELDENGLLKRELRGFRLSRSGTADLPIVIEGVGSIRPAIDQGQTSSTAGRAVLGLYLDCVSHVVIRNLEIRNVSEAGISSSIDGACQTTNIVIEKNHIHDVYGEKYVGGVRMMGVSNLVVRDNEITDVFSDQVADNKNLFKAGRGISGLVVENNRLATVGVGLLVNAQGTANSAFGLGNSESVADLRVANNIFDSVSGAAISMRQSVADASDTDEEKIGRFFEVDIYGNTFNQVGSATSVDTGSGVFASERLCFFNNTLSTTTAPALDFSGLSDFEIFNTIFDSPLAEVLVARSPGNTVLQNNLAYSDNNAFTDAASLSWRLGEGGLSDAAYSSLSAWQVATHPELGTGGGSPVQVDANSVDNDPMPFNRAGRYGLLLGSGATIPTASSQVPCFTSL